MAKHKSIDIIENHKNTVISAFDDYLSSLLKETPEKCDKLSYWVTDWIRFLKNEETFNPKKLKRYKRGDVIKVHLGFNVGNEEGGLHYAIVIDNNNSINDATIRIIPLTSVKPNKNLNRLRSGEIYLGNEFYRLMQAKLLSSAYSLRLEIKYLQDMITVTDSKNITVPNDILKRINELQKEYSLISNMHTELNKMKTGSIALVSQITTVSKIRIYNPKSVHQSLHGIRLSDSALNQIDAAIIRLYTKS